MKKIFLSLAIVMTGVFAMAQQTKAEVKMVEASAVKAHKKSKQGGYETRLAKMKVDLNLTDSQVSQLKANHEKTQAENLELRKKAKLDRVTFQKKRMEKKDAELKQILTPDQYKTWKLQKEEMMQKRKLKSQKTK